MIPDILQNQEHLELEATFNEFGGVLFNLETIHIKSVKYFILNGNNWPALPFLFQQLEWVELRDCVSQRPYMG